MVGGYQYNFTSPNKYPVAGLNVYDPLHDSWTTATAMPGPRANAAVSAVNGILYVVGGDDFCGTATNHSEQLPSCSQQKLSEVLAYDPEGDSWQPKARLPRSHNDLRAAVVNGTIYAIAPDGTNYVYHP